ncbi:hypothetical protein E2562_038580 [Oryza meyeriana var. granulata]|uniref:Uncharacterized protein n=1 Tax=Oryza meyeriana var. granulata TaxID=110450 RepID=A0A6G1DU49_9ORYZ|nr:hypothetical protein E2562_038580 [Oryza meyeriana var. granulata]
MWNWWRELGKLPCSEGHSGPASHPHGGGHSGPGVPFPSMCGRGKGERWKDSPSLAVSSQEC